MIGGPAIRVGLVDDDSRTLDFYQRHLAREGSFVVVCATNAADAPGALAGAARPNVVVVDGGMLGRSTAQRLRDELPHLKILSVNGLRAAGLASALAPARAGWQAVPEPVQRLGIAIRRLLAGEGPHTITLGLPPTSELIIHFQAVHDLHAGQAIAGFEALLRWGNQGELVPPGEFLPLVEAEGRMTEYDSHVIKGAVGQLRAWGDLPGRPAPRWISVNLGRANLRRPDLPRWLGAVLASAGVAPSSLILEFDHDELMGDLKMSAQRLQELRAIGVRTAVDNVATGPSGLRGVSGLALDVMKISHRLTTELPSPAATETLRGLLQATANRNWPCIAAGIEREDQLEALQRIGWQFAQGHLLSKPMTAFGCERLLAEAAGGQLAPDAPERPLP